MLESILDHHEEAFCPQHRNPYSIHGGDDTCGIFSSPAAEF
jgi:hypothetical protein